MVTNYLTKYLHQLIYHLKLFDKSHEPESIVHKYMCIALLNYEINEGVFLNTYGR